ncbi:creatinase-like [Homarus americanus]|uniref:creatinase-like n=1 Tax=Homarus americanus TaxID=6706 RepID=UPI001C480382|nr:creatinase-like [Homarus americanus]
MSSWAVGRSVWAAGRSLWAAKQSAGTKGPGVWAAGWPVCAPGSRRASNDVTSFRETKTLRMYNGQKVSPGLFSQKEVEGRITRLRQHMEGEGLAACLFTSIHNITYYTGGFVYCAFGRPYGLLVTPEKHVTISALVDGGQPWRRSPHDNIVYTDWQRENYFRAVVEELGEVRGPLGVEYDHLTLHASRTLQHHLPHSNKLVDVSNGTMKMRMIKSHEEIAVIKNCAATSDVGGWACAAALGEGVPEYEIALAGTRAMINNIAKLYPDSELMDTWVWFQSGINTDGAHNPVTTRKIQKGDILSVSCLPLLQGYYSSLERTWFLDHCSDAHLKVWEANVAVHKRGIELIRPGAKCSEIAQELNEMFAQFGLLKYRMFGYGHSFGILSHYYGREADLELREDIDTVLEPGMVVSMEPMVTIPEGEPGAGGYREHDILVINDDGTVDDITGFPFGPEHNIFKK